MMMCVVYYVVHSKPWEKYAYLDASPFYSWVMMTAFSLSALLWHGEASAKLCHDFLRECLTTVKYEILHKEVWLWSAIKTERIRLEKVSEKSYTFFCLLVFLKNVCVPHSAYIWRLIILVGTFSSTDLKLLGFFAG